MTRRLLLRLIFVVGLALPAIQSATSQPAPPRDSDLDPPWIERGLGPLGFTSQAHANLALETIADLIKFDYFFNECQRRAERVNRPQGNYGGPLRTCLINASLPLDCANYRASVSKVAAFVAERPAAEFLAPAMSRLLRICLRRPAAPLAPDPRLPTIIEAANDNTAIVDIRPEHSARLYLSSLCPLVLNGALVNMRLAELIVCLRVQPNRHGENRHVAAIREMLSRSRSNS
jgi:hypothetical protein